MITHYELPGNLDMKLSRFSHYYKAVISAVVGTKQAQRHTSIFGIYVYSKTKYFWLMIKMQKAILAENTGITLLIDTEPSPSKTKQKKP